MLLKPGGTQRGTESVTDEVQNLTLRPCVPKLVCLGNSPLLINEFIFVF